MGETCQIQECLNALQILRGENTYIGVGQKRGRKADVGGRMTGLGLGAIRDGCAVQMPFCMAGEKQGEGGQKSHRHKSNRLEQDESE